MKNIQPDIIGKSYEQLISLIKKYAKNDQPLLLVGETGSGKEVFAKLYMAANERKGQKQTINCAAIPEGLLGSEVFGHVKGAFTDAVQNRLGKVKRCDKGILFLDELGDASRECQALILRVSEGNSFSQVGSDEELTVDTLIIAATDNPVKIREELKMRFNILPVPPLQRSDIPILARHFLGKPLKEEVLRCLMDRNYPGNVRELKRVCESLRVECGDTIFGKGPVIEAGIFDYERFRHEWTLWDKYITPILVKHDLGYKYEYFTPPDPPRGGMSGAQTFRQKMEAKKKPRVRETDPEGFGDTITKLLKGKGEARLLKRFEAFLNNCFREKSLARLFKRLEILNGHDDLPQITKPDLRPLLNLKLHEASKKFEAEYLNYHLLKHALNGKECREAIGVSRSTFGRKLIFHSMKIRHHK